MERIEPSRAAVTFYSASGPLPVKRAGKGYVMDFPVWLSESAPTPSGLAEALGATPVDVFVNQFNYMVLLDSPKTLHALAPDFAAIARLDRGGVIATASGNGEYDFLSRFFAPAEGIPEDPVTGSAHCMLAPFWAKRLNKTEFRAFQASKRGGEVICRLRNDRVEIEGTCVFYFEGQAQI